MKNSFFLTATLMAFLTLASCEKSETYPRGGEIEMAEENLTQSWDLVKYFRNSVDETHLMLISGYSEDYSSPGIYGRTYLKSDQTEVSEQGTYHFSENKLEIHVSSVSSIAGFSNNNSTLSASAFTILKLTANELEYSFENGSEVHEFRFVRNTGIR